MTASPANLPPEGEAPAGGPPAHDATSAAARLPITLLQRRGVEAEVLIPLIRRLEQEIGKPVVSSNSANIWGSFKPLGITVGPGHGTLLGSL